MDELELVGPAAIAERIALDHNLWAAITFRRGELSDGLARIVGELEVADTPRRYVIVAASNSTEVIQNIVLHPHDTVVFVTGVEDLAREELEALDRKRNALLERTLLVCTNQEGLRNLALHAPNIYSWFAGQCFQFDVAEGVMNVQERLESLRNHYRLSDTEVVERAAAGRLPPEPAFVEWLTLLGRGDLLGA
jgi:hypothetical protein